jgi:phosphopantothenoylcysteine decarboxylase/phosphopantothenate--cysteine ligase
VAADSALPHQPNLGALEGRFVVLGVSGGIAAFKAIEVCRLLVDAGAHVAPVLTPPATRFVGELSFSALASEPAQTSLWGGADPIPHTRLGRRADLIVVVPATARLLGAYAGGISSDLLTATLLATRAPVLLAPAMHTEMWEHPAVAENVARLVARGVHLVGPVAGRLAGGDHGAGRLADPGDIVAAAAGVLGGSAGRSDPTRTSGTDEAPAESASRDAAGLRALVTAGGTREPIDAVRFIGNRSSGKQGHAIAAELARRGADVILVTTSELPVAADVRAEIVETAAEMHEAVRRLASAADLVVMAAAVADFRPKTAVAGKLKKADGLPEVMLEPTTDILAELGRSRRPDQILVGFAAEAVSAPPPPGERGGTAAGAGSKLWDLAQGKLSAKHVDLVVANDVTAPGVGFAHDTNEVLILAADGIGTHVPLAEKATIATAVVDAALAYGVRRSNPEPSR